MATEQSIALFFNEGSSDKVYHAAIKRDGPGWIVTFFYGRRGKPLKSGVKTSAPVPYNTAWSIYDKLVREKIGKGYREMESGGIYKHVVGVGRETGFRPQLLTAATTNDAIQMVMKAEPGRYAIQCKKDGERRLISIQGGEFIAANRKGIEVAVNDRIIGALRDLGYTSIALDGEDMGDHFVAFNVLMLNGVSYAEKPFAMAAKLLDDLASIDALSSPDSAIKIEPAVRITSAVGLVKRIEAYRAAGEEGVVLRDMDAPSQPGRGAAGKAPLKIKNVETATVRVRGMNGSKRSVQMEAFDGDDWLDVGSVTVPPNLDIPNVGELIEVRYLYAYPGGSLFQPVLLRRRDDLDDDAATVAQLKFKGDGPRAAAA